MTQELKVDKSINEVVGPFYDDEGIKSRLNSITQEELEVIVNGKECSLLWAMTSDNVRVYPTYQFIEEKLDERFAQINRALTNRKVDPWVKLMWFNMKNTELYGLTPLAWIRRNENFDKLLHIAEVTSYERDNNEEPNKSIYNLPGPYYSKEDTCKVLSISLSELEKMQEEGSVLYAVTADGVHVYPVFQFQDGAIDPRLAPSIFALKNAPQWSAIIWFVLENDDLENLTPLQWIEQGKDLEQLRISALHTAHEWR